MALWLQPGSLGATYLSWPPLVIPYPVNPFLALCQGPLSHTWQPGPGERSLGGVAAQGRNGTIPIFMWAGHEYVCFGEQKKQNPKQQLVWALRAAVTGLGLCAIPSVPHPL